MPSSDAEISLDDETNVVVEEAAEEPEVVAPEAEETVAITYNLNAPEGVTLKKGDADVVGPVAISVAKAPGTLSAEQLPTLEADGYKFGGWYKESTCETAVTTETTFTEASTIYAKWAVDISKLDIELNGAALTFNNTDQKTSVTIKSAKLNGVAL